MHNTETQASCKTRLLLGEADFSFARALITKHQQTYPNLAKFIVATTFESASDLKKNHKNTFPDNYQWLKARGVTVYFGIDAQELHVNTLICANIDGKKQRYKRIHFNAPHDRSNYKKRTLPFIVHRFFASAEQLQEIGDRIHIALPQTAKTGTDDRYFRQGYIYDIYDAAAKAGYRLLKKRSFGSQRYQGYQHQMTSGGGSAPVAENAREYVFEKTSLRYDEIVHHFPPHKTNTYNKARNALPDVNTDYDSSDYIDSDDENQENLCDHKQASEAMTSLFVQRTDKQILLINKLVSYFCESPETLHYIYGVYQQFDWKDAVTDVYYQAAANHPTQALRDRYLVEQFVGQLIILLDPSKYYFMDIAPHALFALRELYHGYGSHFQAVMNKASELIHNQNINWRIKAHALMVIMNYRQVQQFIDVQIIPLLHTCIKYDPRLDWLVFSYLGLINVADSMLNNYSSWHGLKLEEDLRLAVRMLASSDLWSLIKNFYIIKRPLYRYAIFVKALETCAININESLGTLVIELTTDNLSIKSQYPEFHMLTNQQLQPLVIHQDNQFFEFYKKNNDPGLLLQEKAHIPMEHFSRCYKVDRIKRRFINANNSASIDSIFFPVANITFFEDDTGSHKCGEMSGGLVNPVDRHQWQAFYRIGSFFLFGNKGCSKDNQQAADWFRHAADTGHEATLVELVNIYAKNYASFQRDTYGSVLDCCDKVLHHSNLNKSPKIRSNLLACKGYINFMQGKINESRKMIDMALQDDKTNFLARITLEYCNLIQHRTTTSLDMGRKNKLRQQSEANFVDSWWADLLALEDCLSKREDLTNQSFNKTKVILDPVQRRRIILSRARCFALLKHFDDAHKLIDDYLLSNPDDLEAKFCKILILREQGKIDDLFLLLKSTLQTQYYPDMADIFIMELSNNLPLINIDNAAEIMHIISRAKFSFAAIPITIQNYISILVTNLANFLTQDQLFDLRHSLKEICAPSNLFTHIDSLIQNIDAHLPPTLNDLEPGFINAIKDNILKIPDEHESYYDLVVVLSDAKTLAAKTSQCYRSLTRHRGYLIIELPDELHVNNPKPKVFLIQNLTTEPIPLNIAQHHNLQLLYNAIIDEEPSEIKRLLENTTNGLIKAFNLGYHY